MSTIVQMSQDFSGLAWVRYDTAFRRQAALTRNDQWSVINSTLYMMCLKFKGVASTTKRCELCFASTHTECGVIQKPVGRIVYKRLKPRCWLLQAGGLDDQTPPPPSAVAYPGGAQGVRPPPPPQLWRRYSILYGNS